MKRLWLTAAIIICAVTVFTSCSNDDKPAGQKGENAGVPLIILDADIGSSTDDLFALEMLYRYEDEGRCRLLGVMVDREGEQNAAFADMMNTYFGHADTPIGFIRDGIKEPKVWIDYAHVADTKDGEGQPMFSQSIVDYSSLPDGWQPYRRLLAAQPDRSVSIVSVGFVTCLAQLLASGADDDAPGYRVTGPNGNAIFLPAAGIRTGSKLMFNGHEGYYWTSESMYVPHEVFCLRFTPRLVAHSNFISTERWHGCVVRAVTAANIDLIAE